ncbi:MAG: AbrB/MazE/SpoVT family DNA-binding domain-containing protein [Thermoleophilia bacterium]
MRVTSKGQVTIPQHVRERLGLLPHTEVEFILEGDVAYIRKTEAGRRAGRRSRGEILVEQMRRPAAVTMSTDEIMELTRGE